MDNLTPKIRVLVTVLFLSARGTALDLYTVGTLVISDQQPQNFSQITNNCTPNSCEGRVWMYYDDPYIAGEWGTIGGPNIRDYDKQVICRQLGYSMSVPVLNKEPNGNVSGPIVFTNLSCGVRDGKPLVHNNILQCNYDICMTPSESSECFHSNDVIVHCKDSISNSQRYHGEVYLCPPEQKPAGMQTVLGVLQLYHDSTESKSIAIKSIHDVAKNFHTYKADTLCRQMGFTHAVPNSLHVLSAASLHHQLTFGRSCITRSWFDVSQLNECNQEATPTPCFGCCYDYDFSPTCDNCFDGSAMVLSCTYDIFQGQSIVSGSRQLCELKNDKIRNAASTCNRHTGLTATVTGLVSVVTIESILLLFLLPVSATLLYIGRNQVKEKLRRYCLRDYVKIDEVPGRVEDDREERDQCNNLEDPRRGAEQQNLN